MQKQPKIVGLGYQSRTGKDTLARLVIEKATARGLQATKFAFADYLKEYAHQVFGYAGVKSAMFYEQTPEARQRKLELPGSSDVVDLWIDFGQKMRQIDPMVWVRKCFEAIGLAGGYDLIIISDVRFFNEAEEIQKRDGTLVCVQRPGQVVRDSDKHMPHDFEWDHVVMNTGTVEDLDRIAKGLIDTWFPGE